MQKDIVTKESYPITVKEYNEYFYNFNRCYGIEPTDNNMTWYKRLDKTERKAAMEFVKQV